MALDIYESNSIAYILFKYAYTQKDVINGHFVCHKQMGMKYSRYAPELVLSVFINL